MDKSDANVDIIQLEKYYKEVEVPSFFRFIKWLSKLTIVKVMALISLALIVFMVLSSFGFSFVKFYLLGIEINAISIAIFALNLFPYLCPIMIIAVLLSYLLRRS